MQSIRQVARLNDLELEKVVPSNASWHTDYRDTAYIHIGGLPFELSEGDVLTIFSQYGSPTDIKLARDKDTGKSRGFGWLKYEDQRSCDLAVDNLSGAGVLGRVLSVDHARYKMKEGEVETVGDDEVGESSGDETDREGERRRKRRRSEGSESEAERPMLKEEVELAKLLREHDEDDPMKAYLVEEKKAEVEEARKEMAKKDAQRNGRRHWQQQHHHRSTSRRDAKDSRAEREGNRQMSRSEQEQHDDDDERRHHPRRRKRERSTSRYSGDERELMKRKSRMDASDDSCGHDRRKSRHSSSEDSGRIDRRRSKR